MAKLGEGDPRWIAEERPDAMNVNNWHWTEKNATMWSQNRLKDLFTDVTLLEDNQAGILVTITSLDKCEGEANVNNRKGKVIFFYEWVLDLSWTAFVKDSDESEKVSGKIKIPNLSEEQNIDTDIDVQYTLDEASATSACAIRARESLYKRDSGATDKVKQLLNQYVKELKVEYSKDLIKPTSASGATSKDPDGSSGVNSGPSSIRSKSAFSSSHINSSSTSAAAPAKAKTKAGENDAVRTQTLTLSDKFRCTAEELYNALTMPDMVMAMCKDSRAVCEPKAPGGRFSLFGDNVSGEFIELEPPKRIVMKWRRKNWPDGLFSDVTLDISQSEDDGQTTLTVRQQGVPENDVEQTEEGWKRYYFHSIKTTFGFGSFLF